MDTSPERPKTTTCCGLSGEETRNTVCITALSFPNVNTEVPQNSWSEATQKDHLEGPKRGIDVTTQFWPRACRLLDSTDSIDINRGEGQ